MTTTTSLVRVTTSPSTSKPPTAIPARVRDELKREGYPEMPERTRSDASRDHAPQYSLLSTMDRGLLVSMLVIRQSIDEAFRMHCAPKDAPDLARAPASDLTTPNTVSNVNKSFHEDVWQQSKEKEFGRLPEDGAFAPAPA